MDLILFENDIFCQIFNINLNTFVGRNILTFKNIFSMIFSRIFQKYFRNIFQKAITNVVKKQVGVVLVILFTFANQKLLSQILLFEIMYFWTSTKLISKGFFVTILAIR